jgi:hypothetical protein
MFLNTELVTRTPQPVSSIEHNSQEDDPEPSRALVTAL